MRLPTDRGSTSSTPASGGVSSSWRVLLTVLAAAALVAGACASDDAATDSAGGTDSGSEESGDQTEGSDEGASTGEVVMTDVATGESVELAAALTPEGKPLLAWFWAPFCPTCRGEAPELDAYMADNGERVDLVGIGTRDDLDYAEGFLEDTGVSNFALLWEPSGESWVDNAVAAQPYMILFDADGEEVERWPGGASVVQIDEALAGLA